MLKWFICDLCLYVENDSVFEESSLSSSSNQRIDEITKQDDDIIIGVVIGDDLDDDIKLKLNHDYTDDFSSASIENLSKHKQEHNEFINLIKKCQHWIEVIKNKKIFFFPKWILIYNLKIRRLQPKSFYIRMILENL